MRSPSAVHPFDWIMAAAEHFLWYRPTMAALRALKKVDGGDKCGQQKLVAAPRCLRVNNEDFCP